MRPDMNIKAATFTVSEKSINTGAIRVTCACWKGGEWKKDKLSNQIIENNLYL